VCRLAAEAIGTFALVFAGAGAIMVDAKTHQLGHVGVALTFGLVIVAMIYAVGHISGAHFNAAVTFAFALTRHFPWREAVGYWCVQLLGALTAAAILRGSLGTIAHVGARLPSGLQGQSFLGELVMSGFLVFVILAVATDTRAVGEAAAIAIGGTIGLDAMFGGPISGASMNPMRSLGPPPSSAATCTRSGCTSLPPSSAPRSEGSPTSSCAASTQAHQVRRGSPRSERSGTQREEAARPSRSIASRWSWARSSGASGLTRKSTSQRALLAVRSLTSVGSMAVLLTPCCRAVASSASWCPVSSWRQWSR
jgi:aquaporin NIP